MKREKYTGFSQWFWQERDYVDFWNIPHVLFGALFFCVGYIIPLKFTISLASLIIVKIIWEIYENNSVIKETLLNSILDVISGIIGFIFSFYLISDYPNIFNWYFAITFVLFALFGTWGLLNLDNEKKIK